LADMKKKTPEAVAPSARDSCITFQLCVQGQQQRAGRGCQRLSDQCRRGRLQLQAHECITQNNDRQLARSSDWLCCGCTHGACMGSAVVSTMCAEAHRMFVPAANPSFCGQDCCSPTYLPDVQGLHHGNEPALTQQCSGHTQLLLQQRGTASQSVSQSVSQSAGTCMHVDELLLMCVLLTSSQ
jgi:hypothetical protein